MAKVSVEFCNELVSEAVSVGVLLLAAGRSRRFGEDKRLAKLSNGKTVIQATIDQIRGSGLPLKICVASNDVFFSKNFQFADMEIIFCSRSSHGMGATLSQAIESAEDWEGVVIALADMPWVESSTYSKLSRTVSSDLICVPKFRGSWGNPVAFGSFFYPELRALDADVGARLLLGSVEAKYLKQISVNDAGVLRDIDTQQDIT